MEFGELVTEKKIENLRAKGAGKTIRRKVHGNFNFLNVGTASIASKLTP